MFDVISNIFDILIDFFDWVSNLFNEIVDLGIQVANAVSTAISYLSFLPAAVIAVFAAILAVAITYKVLGREG